MSDSDRAERSKYGAHYTPTTLADAFIGDGLAGFESPPTVVFDPACGDRALLDATSRRVPEAELVGCDISADTGADFVGDFLTLTPPARSRVDWVVMNPPFLGNISGAWGSDYLKMLRREYGGKGRVDLSAYFLIAATRWVRPGGCLSGIFTNTIAQGDTRRAWKCLLGEGWTIYAARTNAPWIGDAAVTVSMVHMKYAPTER